MVRYISSRALRATRFCAALAALALCVPVAHAQTSQLPARAVDSSGVAARALTPFGGRVIVLDSVAVNSQLAREGQSPTPFTSLSPSDIRRDYHGQDLPMLLADTPGAYAYSDAGN